MTAEQPPLQFYRQVLRERSWARIDVVTYAADWKSLNPVARVLYVKKKKGLLPDYIHIHTVGQSRICASPRNQSIRVYYICKTVRSASLPGLSEM